MLFDSQLYMAIGSIDALRKTVNTKQMYTAHSKPREAGFILYIALLKLSSIVLFANMLYNVKFKRTDSVKDLLIPAVPQRSKIPQCFTSTC